MKSIISELYFRTSVDFFRLYIQKFSDQTVHFRTGKKAIFWRDSTIIECLKMETIQGNLVDVLREEIYPARISFDEKILEIERQEKSYSRYILPGLIDAHLHIESTMLCPSRFCEAVIPHGTVATVSDPHEIANVAGERGVLYMLEDTPEWSKIRYTAPSCIPATTYETSGARLDADKVGKLLKRREIVGLGEVMDFPGVLQGEKEVMNKIGVAKRVGKAIDGHAPSLSGSDLQKYIDAGIATDHEATSFLEGREKLLKSLKLMIRQGSTARNLRELVGLVEEFPDDCFFVTDDKHVGMLAEGHLDALLREAVELGLDPLLAVKCCTANPARHYGLDTGIIEKGRPADFVIVNDLKKFKVTEVWINGRKVAEEGKCLVKPRPIEFPLCIARYELKRKDFQIRGNGRMERVRTIDILPGQIETRASVEELRVKNNVVLPNKQKEVAWLTCINRYGQAPIAKAFVRGLYVDGAIASSVAHDSHNLVIAGTNDYDMCEAAKAVMRNGGLAFSRSGEVHSVSMPIAGLMSNESATTLAEKIKDLQGLVKEAGCELANPFMQLSFLTLLVVPELKLSDKGLFDSKNFRFVDLFVTTGNV